MKLTSIIAGLLLLLAGASYSQGFNEPEPDRGQLGAPLYPGAVYVRTVQSGLDQYHTTAEYITDDKLETAVAFFERKLPEKREIIYEDKEKYLVAFLLVTWSKIPGTPKKSDLDLLDKESNVQVLAYDSDQYRILIDYFFRKPDGKKKALALENGKTLLRYTFRKSEENVPGEKIVGTWRETDRDMPQFYGSVIKFHTDNTYTFTFTPHNLKTRGKNAAPYVEKGRYAVLENVISLDSENPLDGRGRKNGLVTVGGASLSIELVNMPRLTFLRMNPHDERSRRGERGEKPGRRDRK